VNCHIHFVSRLQYIQLSSHAAFPLPSHTSTRNMYFLSKNYNTSLSMEFTISPKLSSERRYKFGNATCWTSRIFELQGRHGSSSFEIALCPKQRISCLCACRLQVVPAPNPVCIWCLLGITRRSPKGVQVSNGKRESFIVQCVSRIIQDSLLFNLLCEIVDLKVRRSHYTQCSHTFLSIWTKHNYVFRNRIRATFSSNYLYIFECISASKPGY
jgi:hypothetical protein